MIFQALGAKYTISMAIRHLFTKGSKKDISKTEAILKKRYHGEDAVLYYKGRAALAEAVRLATGGEGKVAISGLTCYSLVQAVEAAGCQPVFVDISDDTLHFTADELEKTLSSVSGVKAVIIHNMLGIPVDIKSIAALTHKHAIALIEDLAHSAGATYSDGREVGTVGDFTVLSFGRDKALDTVNGGALVVRQPEVELARPVDAVSHGNQLRDRLYPLIAWTARKLYPINLGSYVMAAAIRMKLVIRSADGEVTISEALPSWQAKLARKQLQHIMTTAKARRTKAAMYLRELDEFAPAGANQDGAALIRVPLLASNRDEIVSHLRKYGVQANDIWYDVPVSPVRFYSAIDYPEADCPVAVRTAARLVNLPTHEQISHVHVAHISRLVQEVAKA